MEKFEELNLKIGLNKHVPFRNYLSKPSRPNYVDVNIVFLDSGCERGGSARMPIIICEENGQYEDFYWNNEEKSFKCLTVAEDYEEFDYSDMDDFGEYPCLTDRERFMSMAEISWDHEDVGIVPPSYFKNSVDLGYVTRP